jgi:hypothetical protein
VRFFDQAARNVACIAEVLRRANRLPQEAPCLGFYVLAPEQHYDWFMPTLDRIDLAALSWEAIISEIAEKDSSEGRLLEDFYVCCMEFNRASVKR